MPPQGEVPDDRRPLSVSDLFRCRPPAGTGGFGPFTGNALTATAPHLALGRQGEERAVEHLRRLGYRIMARNVRTRFGELDLVARDGDTLVFCEVKTRRDGDCGGPAAAIDWRKQQRLVRLAGAFLQQNPQWEELECRFDAVLLWRQGPEWRIQVIADAFRPGWW
ncbi:MAG: YraN family protein [Magnetococcales bacterium]|nr:YraN family protein [Magnetococcales bacterium]